jgi:hypothetical protein
MWAVKNDPVHRYRCHNGHVYTEKHLADQQGEALEASIWVSIRMLEDGTIYSLAWRGMRRKAVTNPWQRYSRNGPGL